MIDQNGQTGVRGEQQGERARGQRVQRVRAAESPFAARRATPAQQAPLPGLPPSGASSGWAELTIANVSADSALRATAPAMMRSSSASGSRATSCSILIASTGGGLGCARKVSRYFSGLCAFKKNAQRVGRCLYGFTDHHAPLFIGFCGPRLDGPRPHGRFPALLLQLLNALLKCVRPLRTERRAPGLVAVGRWPTDACRRAGTPHVRHVAQRGTEAQPPRFVLVVTAGFGGLFRCKICSARQLPFFRFAFPVHVGPFCCWAASHALPCHWPAG